MANPNDISTDLGGLQPNQNEINVSGTPLSVAKNLIINREGMLETRRGFSDFSSNLPINITPDQIFESGGVLYANIDSGLWYFDTSSAKWLRKTASFSKQNGYIPYALVLMNNIIYGGSNNCFVFSINLTTGKTSILAGRPATQGSSDGTGDAARFSAIVGICTDGTSLYAVDMGPGGSGTGQTIRKITTAGVVTTIAGLSGTTGTADGTGAAARFNFDFTTACSICFSGSSLFVTDQGNSSIRRVAPPLTAGAGVVTTIAGLSGTTGTADGTGAAARFNKPEGLTTDGTNLYIGDTGNFSIRRVAPPLTAGAGVVTTIAGLSGVSGSSDGIGVAASFSGIGAMTMLSGNLYVINADKVRQVAPPLTAGAGVVTSPMSSSGLIILGITNDSLNLYISTTGSITGTFKLYLPSFYMGKIDNTLSRILIASGIVIGPS